MEAFFAKSLGTLRPADEKAAELLRGMPMGEVVRVKITRPRNVAHHRKFFALLNLVYQNQERYESLEHLLVALKISVGHFETVVMPSGQIIYTPKSIAFHNMDQGQFEQFYNLCIEKIVKHFLPNATSKALRDEVLELVA